MQVTLNSGEFVLIGETVLLKGRKDRNVQITNITDKWVIFIDLEDGKRKDCSLESFQKNCVKGDGSISEIPTSKSKPVKELKELKKTEFKAPEVPLFTFSKSKKSTGLASIGEAEQWKVNQKNKLCGWILQPSALSKDFDLEENIYIQLMVYKTHLITDNNSNCSWMSITLRKRFKSFDDAKTWLNENRKLIVKQFNLRYDEN